MDEVLKFLLDNPEQANALAAFANVVVALVALLVGIGAILLSAWTLRSQRAHNHLTVQPFPNIIVTDLQNKIRVKLSNNGTGPLIIKNFSVSNGNDNHDRIINFMPQRPEGIFWSIFAGSVVDRSVLPGNEIILIELIGDSSSTKFSMFRENCREVLSKLSIEVTYTDVYARKFPFYIKSLDYFSRIKSSQKKNFDD